VHQEEEEPCISGYDYEGYERTIDAHVKNLRKKIEPDARHPRYVQTVLGAGYRLAKT
jgi:DNA-binding response OmpR family regulator